MKFRLVKSAAVAALVLWPLSASSLVSAPSLIPSQATWMPAAKGFGSSALSVRAVSDSFTYDIPGSTATFESSRGSYTTTARLENFFIAATATNATSDTGYNLSNSTSAGFRVGDLVLAGWSKSLDYNTTFNDQVTGYGTSLKMGDFYLGYGLESHAKGTDSWNANYMGASYLVPGKMKLSFDQKTETAKPGEDATAASVIKDEETQEASVEYLWRQSFLSYRNQQAIKTTQGTGAVEKTTKNSLGLGYMGTSGWTMVIEQSQDTNTNEQRTKLGASWQTR